MTDSSHLPCINLTLRHHVNLLHIFVTMYIKYIKKYRGSQPSSGMAHKVTDLSPSRRYPWFAVPVFENTRKIPKLPWITFIGWGCVRVTWPESGRQHYNGIQKSQRVTIRFYSNVRSNCNG